MRTKAEILADLAECRAEIKEPRTRLEEWYARRLALYKEGRLLAPDLTQREMAEAAGVSEVAVITALTKARKQEEQSSTP